MWATAARSGCTAVTATAAVVAAMTTLVRIPTFVAADTVDTAAPPVPPPAAPVAEAPATAPEAPNPGIAAESAWSTCGLGTSAKAVANSDARRSRLCAVRQRRHPARCADWAGVGASIRASGPRTPAHSVLPSSRSATRVARARTSSDSTALGVVASTSAISSWERPLQWRSTNAWCWVSGSDHSAARTSASASASPSSGPNGAGGSSSAAGVSRRSRMRLSERCFVALISQARGFTSSRPASRAAYACRKTYWTTSSASSRRPVRCSA